MMSSETYEKAKKMLADILEIIRDDIEQAEANLDSFDPLKLAEALLSLKNLAEPDNDDIIVLAKLVKDGQFNMWECPTCEDGTMVSEVRLTAEEWADYQGASGLQDFSSYPGLGHGDKRCDYCRMHMVGEATYKV
jgi:hypothetical protein